MSKLEEAIKNITSYNYLPKHIDEKDIINIGYGIDDGYCRCMASSIVSFCINNKNRNFCFHIIGSNISDINKEKIEKLAQEYNIDIIIYDIDVTYLKNMPDFKLSHFSSAIFYRIILPLIIKDKKYIIYIDADILCLNSVDELFDLDLKDNIAGVVSDLDYMTEWRCPLLNLKNHIYFNSGMLKININLWNQENISSKLIELLKGNQEKFTYPDQDALNILLTQKVKYLNKRYNNINLPGTDPSKIGLIHFTGCPKPWSSIWHFSQPKESLVADIYDFYEQKTPWANMPLEPPTKYEEMRGYVKTLLYKKHFFSAIKWGIKAIFSKF